MLRYFPKPARNFMVAIGLLPQPVKAEPKKVPSAAAKKKKAAAAKKKKAALAAARKEAEEAAKRKAAAELAKKKVPAPKPNLDVQIRNALEDIENNGPSRERFEKVADLHRAIGLPRRSLEYLHMVPAEEKTASVDLRLALSHIRLGDVGRCWDILSNINADELDLSLLTQVHTLRCQIMIERGKYKAALKYLSHVEGELPIQLEIKRLEALAALYRHEEASDGYVKLMDRKGINVGYAQVAISYFHSQNDQSRALALILDASARWPTNLGLKGALARAYWTMGYFPGFVRTIKTALIGPEFISGSIATYALRARRLDPAFDLLIEKAISRIKVVTRKSVPFWALDLAHTVYLLGRHDVAEDIAKRYIDGGGIAPLARYILALCTLSKGEYQAAFSQLKDVLEDAPYLDAVYQAIYMAAAASEDTVNDAAPFLAERRRKITKYRAVDNFGRVSAPNVELILLHYINGEYDKAQSEKANSRPLLSLSNYYPKQRPAKGTLALTGGRSLLIIADDGVSDEVRWAQHYREMSTLYERIEATCEPRLLSIMQRSFPTIKFYPVNRMWAELPRRFSDLREDVPSVGLAHYIDGDTFRRIGDFETVVFTKEMVRSKIREVGTLIPVADEAGYLVPERKLSRQWKKQIGAIAGKRKKVGVVWRSGVLNRRRNRFYFETETLKPLLISGENALFSLQHSVSEEEKKWCNENGVHILDADLMNDFEAIGAIVSQMDVIVGASTFPLELGAAMGIPTMIPGVNFETVAIRLEKGAGAHCRHSANCHIVVDPLGYSDPAADHEDRIDRIMNIIASEIDAGTYGATLAGY